jgi:hypothetical protein
MRSLLVMALVLSAGMMAPAQSPVKMRLEVEVPGVLAKSKAGVYSITIKEPDYADSNLREREITWVLNLPDANFREKADELVGKPAVAVGMAIVHGVTLRTRRTEILDATAPPGSEPRVKEVRELTFPELVLDYKIDVRRLESGKKP